MKNLFQMSPLPFAGDAPRRPAKAGTQPHTRHPRRQPQPSTHPSSPATTATLHTPVIPGPPKAILNPQMSFRAKPRNLRGCLISPSVLSNTGRSGVSGMGWSTSLKVDSSASLRMTIIFRHPLSRSYTLPAFSNLPATRRNPTTHPSSSTQTRHPRPKPVIPDSDRGPL